MSKIIAVVTSFAESHLLRCIIPNIVNTLNPDKIIISEGRMKHGPENKGFYDESVFNARWTYKGEGAVGFDWEETKLLEQEYPNLVEVRAMDYDPRWSATECYVQSITYPSFEIGDTVYCFESDSFLYEDDKIIVEQEVSRLKIGEGLAVKYVDFLETQYYTECVNLGNPKYRRLCYKFDNLENYQKKMGGGYVTQNYHLLKKTDEFFVRHYCWWRPEEYKQLRYDLIYRKDPQYWKDFENGLQKVRKNSTTIALMEKKNIEIGGYCRDSVLFNKVLLRPSRSDEARWAQFIDVEHPEAIKSHPNFVR